MKKKLLSVLLSMSMIAVLATGCGSKETASDDAAETESEGNKITFMAPDWAIPTDEQLDAFTEETGIEVEVSVVGWDDIREKLATAAAAGQCVADVVELDWSWVGEFDAAGWVEELEVSEEDAADMPTLDTFSVDGKVIGIPYSNDYRISFYNTEMFGQANLSEPQTYADVLDACKALKEQGVCEYPMAMSLNAEEKAATTLMWTAYTMDGVCWNEDGTFNEDAVMDALNYMNTCVTEEYVAPEDITTSGGEAYRRLSGGTAAFLVGPTAYVGITQGEDSAVAGKVEPILTPGKDAKAEATMPLPEALAVTSASENKEAAKQFVEWYTSADMQKELYGTLGNLPTRNAVLSDLIEAGEIEGAGAMLEQAERIGSPFPNGVPSYYAEMSAAMYQAINKMALGELTPEEAYAEMSSALDALLNE